MRNSQNKNQYRMPAEWEKQKSTWIAWPHNKSDWPGLFKQIPSVFSKIICEITKVQKVNLLVRSREEIVTLTAILKKTKVNLKNLRIHVCKTNRVWLRDTAPIFIKKNNKKIICNWNFNAWAKYNDFGYDNKIFECVKKNNNFKLLSPKFKGKKIVLEGGAFDVNGKNTLITTKQCLLGRKQVRNKNFESKDYEYIFNKFLGVKKIIWLDKGIDGDDTNGHVDDIARFVSSNVIFIAHETNKKDTNYKNLKNNIKLIENYNQNKKLNLRLVKIPMPKAKYIYGKRVPASYLNFYIANKIVLLPTFKDKKDKLVLNIFKRYFKNRKIIPIDCSNLIWGFGAVHCMTQQEPL
ncbi:MAG: agmatine deiminase [Candidatus Pelagibacter sp.]|nr:agmatine deiminase [Candidatus Pelagibacter sp.]|tara:strand:- start:46608 stop:47657 length:1050 start_codon:yes stop_codon:yes gene_type:complete